MSAFIFILKVFSQTDGVERTEEREPGPSSSEMANESLKNPNLFFSECMREGF